jgi:hypothetical protein
MGRRRDVSLMKRRIVRASIVGRARRQRAFDCGEPVREAQRKPHLRVSLDSIDLVYHPIDTDLFAVCSVAESRRTVARCGLPPDSVILLNVARVSPTEGFALRCTGTPGDSQSLSVGPVDFCRRDHRSAVARAARTRGAKALGVTDHFHVFRQPPRCD